MFCIFFFFGASACRLAANKWRMKSHSTNTHSHTHTRTPILAHTLVHTHMCDNFPALCLLLVMINVEVFFFAAFGLLHSAYSVAMELAAMPDGQQDTKECA